MPLVFFCLWLLFETQVHAEVISTGVGQIDQNIVTSREVQMLWLINAVLDGPSKVALTPPDLDSPAFIKAAQSVLLDWALVREAQSLNSTELKSEDILRADRQVHRALSTEPVWATLEISPPEFNEGLRRLLRARKFVQFREQASVSPYTEGELKRHYEENRAKFHDLAFENARENIKSSLHHARVEKRMQDWFESLRRKYQIKLFIAET